MSDNNTKDQQIEDFKAILQKDAEMERLQADLKEKRTKVELKRYTNLANQIDASEKDLELAKHLDLSQMSVSQIADIQKSNEEYMAAAQNCMQFLCPTFEGYVPFFRKNVILIGAESGFGKSTAAANIAFHAMKQVNPATGKKCKVLIITNEEQSEDCINRITCLNKGWDYSDHAKFTKEQRDTFTRAIPFLTKDGRLTVIDDDYGGVPGMTTTVEGFESIFDNLIRNKVEYDLVIIDYIQNFDESKVEPNLESWQVLTKVAKLLNYYKNIYSAPIVVFSQLKSDSEENPKSFKERIEGRKSLFNVATMAMEIRAVHADFKTNWIIWKNRFNKGIGQTLKTAFQKGMYIEYTNEFAENVERIKLHRESKAMDKAIGIKEVFEDKKDETK